VHDGFFLSVIESISIFRIAKNYPFGRMPNRAGDIAGEEVYFRAENFSPAFEGGNRMAKPDRQKLLDLFKDLRVADVRDGMDWNMMHGFGSMGRDMRPLWRTRVVGIARTYRYVPYTGPQPSVKPEEYGEWVSWYYKEVCTFPWEKEPEEGDIIVIEQTSPTGAIVGSNNSLQAIKRGARGFVVANGAVRDTDELILQKVPVWCQAITQDMVQARIQFDAKQVPVSVGGVRVCPGDIIVADGDGVIVVPQEKALEVAKYASQELRNDKAARRRLYEEIGMELDDSVL